VAPRSALTVALAARLLPTLERDARAISETARLRGLDLRRGSWAARARRGAPLALPLLGRAGARLDVAEAMVARGYAAGPRTRAARTPLRRTEWGVLAVGCALVLAAVASIFTPVADYAYYPTMDPVLAPGAILIAACAGAALGGSAILLRRR